jgi:hypothetical protein
MSAPPQWQDVGVPSTFPAINPAVNRRHVLAGGGLLAMLAVVTSACGSGPPPVDDLESQRQSALRDSELATAAAATASPSIAPALAEVAAERAEHAHALAAEITRVTGDAEPAATETSEAAEPTGTSEPARPAPRVSDVIDALRNAADSAGTLATQVSGYRAGLLASIAAACTTAGAVMLVNQP